MHFQESGVEITHFSIEPLRHSELYQLSITFQPSAAFHRSVTFPRPFAELPNQCISYLVLFKSCLKSFGSSAPRYWLECLAGIILLNVWDPVWILAILCWIYVIRYGFIWFSGDLMWSGVDVCDVLLELFYSSVTRIPPGLSGMRCFTSNREMEAMKNWNSEELGSWEIEKLRSWRVVEWSGIVAFWRIVEILKYLD